ncbi:hypothetical protein LA080_008060 [Diaporthe eres]|nr:hypothetical protein LA080_008060 [Diaporthe eres]
MANKSNARETGRSLLSIFLNNFTDSDNEGSAEFWAWGLQHNPVVKGIYIAEPRWVNLDYYMTNTDFKRCLSLIGRLQPPLEGGDSSLTTLLAGRLTQNMIKSRQINSRQLTEDERDLLARCIKPTIRSKEDSIKHAELLALDYLATMRKRRSRFECYLDVACLGKLASPINLKAHHHEELVARTAEELDEFRTIMDMPTFDEPQGEERRGKFQEWYSKAIERKKEEFGGASPFEELNYKYLASQIRAHDEVMFFGGASLTILQKLLEKDSALGKKIRYYQ